MFIGHYGVALATKKYRPNISLGLLFFAVQLLDVLFCTFVLVGIEKMRIVPGFTSYNSYDLYFMPFTHSLVGALVWSFVFALVLWTGLWKFKRTSISSAAVVALAVFSHFLLDVPMHTADLPIGFSDESFKIGLGLWNHKWLSLLAETFCFGWGAFIYLKSTNISSNRRRSLASVFFLLMFLILLATPFLPSPQTPADFAYQALAAYLGLSLAAEWISRVQF